MSSTANQEPTLADVIEKLNQVSTDVDKLTTKIEKLTTEVDKMSRDSEKFNERFLNYQQAMQWVVQLAFTLIASATITIIISSVLRR
ncbi:MAG TPA: hypothetical protein IGS52_02425 [Oscillatoriaceae cyanobacterium M33_DOE_052]|uniref:Uncharacterized protein n=1 Tax=Planktothricoides sp. SpSt-374 TaxID=2282167 RepID=A0A7C3VQP6_9CYAN|nr:hypothetical protein [Oscillatoriaceae cyanobacterium M33_DOE_052]